MNPDRWQKIEQIYNAAMELEPDRREAYLVEACSGDESLRKEIQALLHSNSESGGFMKEPAMEFAARALAEDRAAGQAFTLTGRTIAHYEVLKKLGAGGMGVVYKARDTHLKRPVALKFLPEEFTLDAERLARFQREAQVLASLSHPNIATLHGLEESDGKRFIVMELIEGQTLAQRILKGPLPVGETLDVCRQIAEGLEAAHEKGVIHRDLKPANVQLTPDGKVKILDFGLARAFHDQPSDVDQTHSPTITEPMTRPGVVLGTAAYTSPEQAKGKTVDKRVDIWGFGCVMFECLTGKRAFRGDGISEVMAKILEAEPDWQTLPPMTPRKVKDLLHRCLQKDPKERLHDIADARIEIAEALDVPLDRETIPVNKIRLPWIAVALILGILLGGIAASFITQHVGVPAPLPVVRFMIDLPRGTQLTRDWMVPTRAELALSPDGNNLVYSASADGTSSKATLYRRALGRAEAEPIKGTESARQPFFSPDGKWIGYWASGKLYKIPAYEGIPKDLGEFPSLPMGASWSEDGKSIFVGDQNTIRWISAEGESLKVLTTIDPTRDAQHTLPCALPGSNAVLFTAMPDAFGSRARVEAVSLSNGTRKVLIEDGADARYVSTGHLVFLRRGLLMAAPFNPERLEVTGPAVPALTGVEQALNMGSSGWHSGAGQFSVSKSGILIYAPGGISHGAENELAWANREGQVEVLRGFDKPSVANQVRIGPTDGQRLAFIEQAGTVWLFDFDRATYTKMAPEGVAASPRWSPDGQRLAFAWSAAGTMDIWLASMAGGAMERMIESKSDKWPSSWSPDGRFLAFMEANPSRGLDILIYGVEDRKVVPFLNSQWNESYPEFSPDGRWMAYGSNETGRLEIYVRSFPDGRQKLAISNQGGSQPCWSSDGRELFYLSRPPTKLMKVDVHVAPKFSAELPKELFQFPFVHCYPVRGYDLHPDGRRFLGTRNKQPEKPIEITHLSTVLNWFEELKRLVPTGK